MSNFIDKTLKDINKILKDALLFEEIKESFLSKINEKIKVVSLLFLLVFLSFFQKLNSIIVLYLFSIYLGYIGKIDIKVLLRRTWIFIPFFTLIIAIPSIFMIPGKLSLGFTREGLMSAIRFILRVATSISYIQIFILTTPWTKIFSGLRGMGIPSLIITILLITYRYILLLLKIAEDLHLAKKSRTININWKREQSWIGNTIGILAVKTHELSKEVSQGMISRGITKELVFLNNSKISNKDILVLIFTIFILLIVLLSVEV